MKRQFSTLLHLFTLIALCASGIVLASPTVTPMPSRLVIDHSLFTITAPAALNIVFIKYQEFISTSW